MNNNLLGESIELLRYLMKNKDTEDFSSYFSASTICRRIGNVKVAEINPLLKELVEAEAIIPSVEFFRAPKFILNTGKGRKILEAIEEENTIYTQEYRDALEEEIKKYKKFVITTAVIGKNINREFADSLRNYARRNEALLLVLPCEDVVSRGKKAQKTLEASEDY